MMIDRYQHEVVQVVSRIEKTDRIAVAVITHTLNLAQRYCGRFLLIQNGLVYEYILTAEDIQDVYLVDAQIVESAKHKMVVVNEL